MVESAPASHLEGKSHSTVRWLFDTLVYRLRPDGIIEKDKQFRDVLEHEGVNPVRLPPRSPNLTPHIERFIGSIKQECLSRLIFFGEHSLRHAIRAYLVHHHQERNHQGLGNQIPVPGDEVGRASGEIQSRERLGGLLRYYYRKAA